MESASIPANAPGDTQVGEKGLKAGALGYLSNLVIGVASTAPGYSLAATLGFVVAVAGVGLHAPAVLIVSFVPMLLIAAAYNYMNKADPDCGTSFTWVTRAMGPRLGWLTGWAIVVSDVVVMATLAYIAGVYTFLLFGLDAASENLLDISIAAAVWIALMTWICYRGIELSARTQYFLLAAEIITLALFSIVALWKVYISGGAPAGSVHVGLDWFNPFNLPGGTTALVDGVLLGIFIYWGWDSGVVVNEESENSASGPGRAAVMSTILLVLIYVVVAVAAQAFAGPQSLIENADDVLSALGGEVFGSPLDKLLIIAVLTSASASTQTTILPTARTTLSMARFGAAPKKLGDIHPRYLTPATSTLLMGAVSLAWTLFIINISTNVLADSITGLAFQIAFYYGLTGFACAFYYRRELFKSFKNFVMVGVAPTLGGLLLAGIFIKAFSDYNTTSTEVNYTGGVFGIGTPVAIGVGMLLLGVVVMVFANVAYPKFFKRKTEVADPGILDGSVVGRASVMEDT
ncbi:MAG TPA: APC family permease [Solirubrobacterales bacterium]|nr:APC family permease [Solirubrobacterales bacterium]